MFIVTFECEIRDTNRFPRFSDQLNRVVGSIFGGNVGCANVQYKWNSVTNRRKRLKSGIFVAKCPVQSHLWVWKPGFWERSYPFSQILRPAESRGGVQFFIRAHLQPVAHGKWKTIKYAETSQTLDQDCSDIYRQKVKGILGQTDCTNKHNTIQYTY